MKIYTTRNTLLLEISAETLAGANLTEAHLEGANLYRANLTGANLHRANLAGADLYRANLTEAHLTGANLRSADLEGANLEGVDLRSADLEGAHLGGANLTGANLTGANLTGANLEGANIIIGGTDIRGYLFYAYPNENRTDITIHAGCRTFNAFADAYAHWHGRHLENPILHADCLSLVDRIVHMAYVRNWLQP